ncbi:MAG: hypothetical protein ACREGA_00285 [Candidatus Saccharimonadales bacterium]
MAKSPSVKQLKIDKANATIVAVTSVAAFVIIFSFIASRALISQMGYQNRVAAARKTALTQLKSDVSVEQNLNASYKAFETQTQNIIGGNSSGQQASDGDNAQIVLDALPSKYDFPALTSSLQALLSRQSINIDEIGGTDDQLQQQNTASASPAPVAMPFSFKIDGGYQNIQKVVSDFQNSIRPLQPLTMKLSGNQNDLTLEASYQTYYQPGKKFVITSREIQ